MQSTKLSTSFLVWQDKVKYEHLIAGVTAGMTSTLVLHPLDLIKTRFAVHDGRSVALPKYGGIWHALTTIGKQEGLRGLYRGVTPNLWGSGTAWGLYFFFYNSIKCSLQNGDVNKALSPNLHLMSAAQAGAITLLITNPIWVVKTRMCLQYNESTVVTKQQYTGMVDALVKIFKMEGVRGYYKGKFFNRRFTLKQLGPFVDMLEVCYN